MSYGTKYILKASTKLLEYYEIKFDFLNYSGLTTEIQGTDHFLQLRSTNGDENRLEAILGTEALIEIYVMDDTITIVDLIATHDSDIKVTCTRIDQATGEQFIHFQGFVVVEDNNQPFLDPPFTLKLRALDGLGLLKGVDLVDTNGLLFTGPQTINQWIGQILYKTNQEVPVRVYFNFFPKDFSEITALTEISLSAITFSQGDAFNIAPDDPSIDINKTAADDCYTALEKIIRCLRCRLFFEDGRFMIVNLKEYTNPNYNFAEYTFGTPSGGIVPMNPSSVGMKNYSVTIGKEEMMYPAEKDQLLYLKLAYKYVKLTYDYNQSLNKICNQDLTEGTRNATYDTTVPNTYSTPPPTTLVRQGYDAYCWTHQQGPSGTPVAPTGYGYIGDVIDPLDYTVDRYLVVQEQGTITYFRSSEVLVDSGDKLEISFSVRTLVDRGPQALTAVAYVLFYGDNGDHYTLFSNDNNPIANPTAWVLSNAGFTSAVQFVGHQFFTQTNQFESVSLPTPLPQVPGQGHIVVIFPSSLTGSQETWFKDIRLTVHPFLNNSFVELKGDYNFSGSNENIKQTFTESVEISDSPKRYFKGALLNPDGVTLIPPDWHRRGVTEHFRFTQAMERILYNLLYRMVYKIEGSFRGLVYRDNDNFASLRPVGFLNSYFFLDGDFPTKKFILTSFDIDVYEGQGRRVFVEIQNDENDSGWVTPDVYKFSMGPGGTPISPPAIPALRLIWDDLANVPVASASSVSDWNTFFDTGTNAVTPFSGVAIVGNEVQLFGATDLVLKDNLFSPAFVPNNHIVSVIDEAACIIEVGNYVFYQDTAIVNVTFPVATIIGHDAFYTCTVFNSITAPLVTSIGVNSFFGCTALAAISLPALTTIGADSFDTCSNLVSIDIPLVTNIDDNAFAACTNLIDILSLQNVITMGNSVFQGCVNMTPPLFNNLTDIGSACFYGCSIMNSFVAPVLVNIGSTAFANCVALTNIYIPACAVLGISAGDDLVFDSIVGNAITLTILTATSTDGDVVYLQANNTVTLILV